MGKRYGLFLVFLIASHYTITVAQEANLTPEDEERIALDLIKEYEETELNQMVEKAPETPEFTAQEEDDVEGRFFFFAFLPLIFKLAKIAIIAVKIAIKAKAVITAVATAVKAKAVVAAAAVKTYVAAKATAAVAAVKTAVTTKAGFVAAAKGAAKLVVKEVITEAVVDGVEQVITKAVNGGSSGDEGDTEGEPETEEEEVTTKKADMIKDWNKKLNKRRCRCLTNDTCQCCLKPEGFERGCFRIKHLPEQNKIRFRMLYAGKTIMTKKMKLKKEKKLFCGDLPEPLNKINVCVVTFGFQKIKNGFKQCFSVDSNTRIGRTICMIKRRGMDTTIES